MQKRSNNIAFCARKGAENFFFVSGNMLSHYRFATYKQTYINTYLITYIYIFLVIDLPTYHRFMYIPPSFLFSVLYFFFHSCFSMPHHNLAFLLKIGQCWVSPHAPENVSIPLLFKHWLQLLHPAVTSQADGFSASSPEWNGKNSCQSSSRLTPFETICAVPSSWCTFGGFMEI